jgi:hypothetical protein
LAYIWAAKFGKVMQAVLLVKNTLIDFNLQKEQQINFFVTVELFSPLLANVRISSTTIDNMGETNSTQEFNVDDESTLIYNDVNIDVDVRYVDYSLYYQLFDNGSFSFDLGLTAWDFEDAITVTETEIIETIRKVDEWHESCISLRVWCLPLLITSFNTHSGKIKTDEIEPMLYVATNISLPLTNLSAFAQADFSLIDYHSFYDYQVGLSYYLIDSRMVDLKLLL